MPQMRRKVPFSGKKKKEQILTKRQSKAGSQKYLKTSYNSDDDTEDTSDHVRKINAQPSRGRNKNVNRFNLQFHEESKKELELMKQEAYLPFKSVEPTEREMDHRFFQNYDFPIRPEWHYGMSKEELDRNENRYFTNYVENMGKLHREENKHLSLFELNLETWRQLWRVLELSDILLIIVDVRYSTLMFPPSLYEYIVHTMKKNAILILNKVDLVAPEVVLGWKRYFSATYSNLPVVIFASMKASAKGRISYKRSIEGVHNLFQECKKIVQSEVDLSGWEQKILEDLKEDYVDSDQAGREETATHNENTEFNFEKHEQFKNGVLTLGCIGFPNVGKSSFINAMKGRKVVSVSRTPGHTKHFQTIFLTNNVKLCDCPGLVFPSCTPKYLQVLLGSYPISQLRQPYQSLKFLGERLDLPKALKIHLPPDFDEWSAIAVCEAWALKRGFKTAKANRPDHYRAANHLLRMCLAGQLVLEFFPPGFMASADEFRSHPDTKEIAKFQGKDREAMEEESASDCLSDADSDGDDSDNESSSDESLAGDDSDRAFNQKSKNAFAVLDEV